MDILYYENLKRCSYFCSKYKRPGKYFSFNILDMDIEANYYDYSEEENTIYLLRAGKELRISHWIHAYIAFQYFKSIGKDVQRVIIELENKKIYVSKSEILRKEKWILKKLGKLKNKYKEPGSHCRFCNIKNQCHQKFLNNGNLYIVPAMSAFAIEKFNEMEVDPLDIIRTDQIDKFSSFIHRKALYNLKSLIYKKPIILEKYKLPEEYIIFDVETYNNNDFLFGFLDEGKYISFLFEKKDKRKYQKMIDYLLNRKKTLVHYDIHDIQSMVNIANNFPELRKSINEVIKNSVDLFEVVIKNYSFPVTSYSLKDISKYFGFKWRTNLNGYAVIVEYQYYLKNKGNTLQTILDYNEDDCRATKLLAEKICEINKTEECHG